MGIWYGGPVGMGKKISVFANPVLSPKTLCGVLLMLLPVMGCGTNIPEIVGESPLVAGTYTGTLTGKEIDTDYSTGEVTEIPLNLPSTEIIDPDGLPCNMNGQSVFIGMVLKSRLGGVEVEDVVQGIIANPDGVTINTTMSVQIKIGFARVITLTGRRNMVYSYQDEQTIHVRISSVASDKTGRYSATVETDGLLSRS